jgi:hypothetical protein
MPRFAPDSGLHFRPAFQGMKRDRTQRKKRSENYQPDFNASKEHVRGLRVRGGKFYAQLRANDGEPYRYPTDDAETIPQAVLGRQALKLKQKAGTRFPPGKATPAKNAGPNAGPNTNENVGRTKSN